MQLIVSFTAALTLLSHSVTFLLLEWRIMQKMAHKGRSDFRVVWSLNGPLQRQPLCSVGYKEHTHYFERFLLVSAFDFKLI